jgi:hypothetical protein
MDSKKIILPGFTNELDIINPSSLDSGLDSKSSILKSLITKDPSRFTPKHDIIHPTSAEELSTSKLNKDIFTKYK